MNVEHEPLIIAIKVYHSVKKTSKNYQNPKKKQKYLKIMNIKTLTNVS